MMGAGGKKQASECRAGDWRVTWGSWRVDDEKNRNNLPVDQSVL
jgi:hypothetical protein